MVVQFKFHIMAVVSPFRDHVFINQNYIIQVSEFDKKDAVYNTETGDFDVVDLYKKPRITSANGLIEFLKDEKLKIKLFKTLLDSPAQKHVVLIRNRLRIKIWSK